MGAPNEALRVLAFEIIRIVALGALAIVVLGFVLSLVCDLCECRYFRRGHGRAQALRSMP